MSTVVGLKERCGGVGAAVEAAMVIMVSVGTPTGVARRLSTGEIIFIGS